MDTIHCQGLFFQSMLRYIRTQCKGKGRKAREERLFTAVLAKNGIANPSKFQLQKVRREVRELLTPGQELVDRYTPSFLIGRAAAFSYEDLHRVLKKWRP